MNSISTIIPIIALFAFIGAYLLLGYIASRRIKSTTDFFLAGKQLGLFPLTFSLLASQIGSGMLLGTFDEAYTHGLFSLAYPFGLASGFLILGLGVASRLRTLDVSTTAEIFEKYYKSIRLKQVASLLSIATMCGLLIGQIAALRTVIDTISGKSPFVFGAFWFLVISHTMTGGLTALAVTETVRTLFIMTIFGGVFGYIFSHSSLPFFNLKSLMSLQETYFSHPYPLDNTSNINNTGSWETFWPFLPILIMPALFSCIEQDLAQRFFAARSKQIAQWAALCACVLLLGFACIPAYFGLQAHILGFTTNTNTNITMGTYPLFYFIEAVTNKWVLFLVNFGLIAAITSTSDSLLCAISSNVSLDFSLTWTRIKNPLMQSRIATLIIGVTVFIASHLVPSRIITILVESYALSVCCLLVPLAAVYIGRPAGKRAAACAIFTGLIAFILCNKLLASPTRELLPLVLSFIGYLVGMLLEKIKPEKAT